MGITKRMAMEEEQHHNHHHQHHHPISNNDGSFSSQQLFFMWSEQFLSELDHNMPNEIKIFLDASKDGIKDMEPAMKVYYYTAKTSLNSFLESEAGQPIAKYLEQVPSLSINVPSAFCCKYDLMYSLFLIVIFWHCIKVIRLIVKTICYFIKTFLWIISCGCLFSNKSVDEEQITSNSSRHQGNNAQEGGK